MPIRLINGAPYRTGVFAGLNQRTTAGRSATSAFRGPPGARRSPASIVYNAAIGQRIGTAQLSGTTKKFSAGGELPVSRPVAVFDMDSLRLLAATVSNAAGEYTFSGLPMAKYFVIAFDPSHNYRAVVADNLTPEIMV